MSKKDLEKNLKYKDGEIVGIVSKEGEKIDLIEKIFPYEYDGKVEMWLYRLEQSMKKSI